MVIKEMNLNTQMGTWGTGDIGTECASEFERVIVIASTEKGLDIVCKLVMDYRPPLDNDSEVK